MINTMFIWRFVINYSLSIFVSRVKGGIRPHFNFSELCGENDQNKLGRIYT